MSEKQDKFELLLNYFNDFGAAWDALKEAGLENLTEDQRARLTEILKPHLERCAKIEAEISRRGMGLN
jgi:hypothetical protein